MRNRIIAALIAAPALVLAWLVAQDSLGSTVSATVGSAGGAWAVAVVGALGGWIGVAIYQSSQKHKTDGL